MPTLSHTSGLFYTDRRSRQRIQSLAASYVLDAYTIKTIALTIGTSEIVAVKKVFIAAFGRPTLIRISNTSGVSVDLTVQGLVSLPFEGAIEIVNPPTATMTDPLRVTYVSG